MRWFRGMAMVLVGIMLLTISGSAFAAVKDDTVSPLYLYTRKVKASLTISDSGKAASAATEGYYPSNEYARKNDSTKWYASIRVTKWSAIPKKNLHTGIVGPGMTPYTTFKWMSPPSETSESVRVFSKYKSDYVVYTGTSYKHYAAMRLNTDETVSTVKVSGVFTPDSK